MILLALVAQSVFSVVSNKTVVRAQARQAVSHARPAHLLQSFHDRLLSRDLYTSLGTSWASRDEAPPTQVREPLPENGSRERKRSPRLARREGVLPTDSSANPEQAIAGCVLASIALVSALSAFACYPPRKEEDARGALSEAARSTWGLGLRAWTLEIGRLARPVPPPTKRAYARHPHIRSSAGARIFWGRVATHR